MRRTCAAIALFLAVGRAGRVEKNLRNHGLNGPVSAEPLHEISFHNAPSADYPDKQIEDKLPEQGFTSDHSRADNPPVHHTNWDTATADWGSEYGPKHLHWSPWEGDMKKKYEETYGPDYSSGPGRAVAPSSPSGPEKPRPPPWVKSFAASQVLGGLVAIVSVMMF